MSWSVNRTGKKDVIRALVEQDFDAAAKGYEGQTEQKDVLAAKQSILDAIDEATFTPDAPEPQSNAYNPNAIEVKAHGSRSKGYVSISVNVARVRVEGL